MSITNSQPATPVLDDDDLPWSQRTWMYQLRPFRGMYWDVKRRIPYFWVDWTTASEPSRIIPSTFS